MIKSVPVQTTIKREIFKTRKGQGRQSLRKLIIVHVFNTETYITKNILDILIMYIL